MAIRIRSISIASPSFNTSEINCPSVEMAVAYAVAWKHSDKG